MRALISLILVVLVAGCTSTNWLPDAARSAGLSHAEARKLIESASAHHKLPAVGLEKSGNDVVIIYLSRDRILHSGVAARFEKTGGVWIEKDSGPFWVD